MSGIYDRLKHELNFIASTIIKIELLISLIIKQFSVLLLSFIGEAWGLRGRVSTFTYRPDDTGKIPVLLAAGTDPVARWIHIFL